jgi:ribosome-associated heat shock protein Hsp15
LTPACRADVWLWRARFYKTRALAARAIADGQVRLSGHGRSRVLEKAAAALHADDGLTLRLPLGRGGHVLKTVRILALGERRGPPAEARLLYRQVEP